jgi:putative transcriptional regulator
MCIPAFSGIKIAVMSGINLTHHFLLAMPGMTDPNFTGALTYLCDHGEQGALGIVVNRPMTLTLGGLFEQIGLDSTNERLGRQPVYLGGPVQNERGFVLHRPIGTWSSTLSVGGQVGLTTSKDILEATARSEGPEQIIVSLGYAGWAAGQLEEEIKQNAWLTVPADPEVIFALPPAKRLNAALRILGIDMAMLSDEAGHA